MTTVVKFMSTMIAVVMGDTALLNGSNAEPTRASMTVIVFDGLYLQ